MTSFEAQWGGCNCNPHPFPPPGYATVYGVTQYVEYCSTNPAAWLLFMCLKLFKQIRFVQCLAPSLLSSGKGIKLERSINQQHDKLQKPTDLG